LKDIGSGLGVKGTNGHNSGRRSSRKKTVSKNISNPGSARSLNKTNSVREID